MSDSLLGEAAYRNVVVLSDGRIDCEVEHPLFGWIPFTASADDPSTDGAAFYARIVAERAA